MAMVSDQRKGGSRRRVEPRLYVYVYMCGFVIDKYGSRVELGWWTEI